VSLHQSALNAWVMKALHALKDTWVFRAWVYCVVLLVWLAATVALGLRQHHGAFLVGAGALAKELLYLLWWPGFDFRYHWWTVITVMLMPMMVIPVLIRRKGSAPARDGSHPQTLPLPRG
jgi:hypothetical protein